MFGFPVTLVHQGNSVYRTEVGSMFTLLLVVAILTFFVMKIQTLVAQDSQQSYSYFSTDRDLYDID